MFSKLLLVAATLQAVAFAAPHGTKHHSHHKVHQANITAPISTRASLGNAIINNRCSYDIWMWSVDQTHAAPAVKISAGSTHSEPARSSCEGCGTSMKISTSSTLSTGTQTQFEYSFAAGQIWYDISFVDCANGNDASSCPGHADGLAMSTSDSSCTSVKCAPGAYCPDQAYYVDFPSAKTGVMDPNFPCAQGVDVISTVC